METQKPLLKDEDGEEVDVHMYRSMIGSLMYLTSSRPDIMFAVCACARYQVNPKVSHLHAMKRIFRYLKGQLKLGLWYPKDSPFDLVAYTDSDYARASLDRKSTTGGKAKKSVRLMMEKLFGMELELILVVVMGDTIAQTRFENVSKHSNDSLLARDEYITLANVQDDVDNEMFDVNALNDEEVFVVEQEVATNEKDDNGEITLAQALIEMKSTKPKVKGIVFQELGKSTTTTTTTISSQQSQDKGKRIMIEEPLKPMKKKVQIMLDEEVASKLQAEFDEEERLAREKAKKEKEANVALTKEWDDIQAKIEADHELSQRLHAKEQEELSDA
ncbi:hypothetical protein Tco_1145219 [Tanacetum coccineum]